MSQCHITICNQFFYSPTRTTTLTTIFNFMKKNINLTFLKLKWGIWNQLWIMNFSWEHVNLMLKRFKVQLMKFLSWLLIYYISRFVLWRQIIVRWKLLIIINLLSKSRVFIHSFLFNTNWPPAKIEIFFNIYETWCWFSRVYRQFLRCQLDDDHHHVVQGRHDVRYPGQS